MSVNSEIYNDYIIDFTDYIFQRIYIIDFTDFNRFYYIWLYLSKFPEWLFSNQSSHYTFYRSNISIFNIKRPHYENSILFPEELTSFDSVQYMTSFDTKPAFINIPLEETIDIVQNNGYLIVQLVISLFHVEDTVKIHFNHFCLSYIFV